MSIPNMKKIMAAREKTFGQLYNEKETDESSSSVIELLNSLFQYIEFSNNKIIKHLEDLTVKIDKLGDYKK